MTSERLAPGGELGRYRIVSEIGAGGMGVVYRATDTVLRRDVAIKVLPPEVAHDPDRLARFRREAQMLAAINHPNIATLHGLEQTDGIQYLVMELVPGTTLAEQIGAGSIPLPAVLSIAGQLAEALEAAHREGVIHRDIKPANIKVTPEGRVKVLDFGLAKLPALTGLAADTESTMTAGPTLDGAVVGTPGYMSPEQVRGQAVTSRSDIWSFGCVFFELLAGRRAFGGNTVTDTLARVLERDPDWKVLPAATPRQVVELIRSCLQKDPALRPAALGDARRIIESSSRRRWRPDRRHLIVAAACALVLLALAVFSRFEKRATPRVSLAILPLTNETGDHELDYLSQGISESLIADFSRTPGLKVVSRDSAFHYAGTSQDPREVGRALGATRLLKGRLLQRGNNLGVSVDLVNTSDGTTLWSEKWERPASGLLLIEREIDAALRLKLSVAEGTRPTPSTGNPEAYRLYLRGRYFWNTRTEANLRRSAEAFQQAIDSDPAYSLAWAGLADAFLMLGGWSVLAPKEAYPRAKAAAERAIALDPALVEPHATLGYLKTIYEWDWPGADTEFRRAFDLHPDYATARHWYAFYLQTIGDIEGSLAQIERASEIDPLSPVINSERAFFYLYARQFERALQEAQKFIAIEPSSVHGRTILAQAYAETHQTREAAAEVDGLMAGPKPDVVFLSSIAVVYARIGERQKALGLIRELRDASASRYVNPAILARAYGALGDRDRAFECLERSIADRSLVASWLRGPEFEPIRSDPRFKALLARLGLKA